MASYALGVKYCSKCEVYLFHKGIFCPCCGRQLRTRPLTRKCKSKRLANKIAQPAQDIGALDS
jgi:uncharacterized Zn finger protein (UPF0148 family)